MAYEKDALVQKILDIAEAQLFRHGYKALNLNEVAKEVGISKVTLYKVCESKYVLAEKVVQRFLAAADAEMTALLAGSLPLEEKLRRGIGILSSLYLRMDGRFLADLQSSLPALWQLIDETRKRREQALAALFAEAQQRGEVRADVDAGLLAAALLILVRGIYQPAFFIAHDISAARAGEMIVQLVLHGMLTEALPEETAGKGEDDGGTSDHRDRPCG